MEMLDLVFESYLYFHSNWLQLQPLSRPKLCACRISSQTSTLLGSFTWWKVNPGTFKKRRTERSSYHPFLSGAPFFGVTSGLNFGEGLSGHFSVHAGNDQSVVPSSWEWLHVQYKYMEIYIVIVIHIYIYVRVYIILSYTWPHPCPS